MKKILLLISALFVIYIVGIFTFPETFGNISKKLGLSNFQNSIISIKNNIQDFILEFDVVGKITETKEKTLEIKQNVETQIQDTKNKIEDIQNSVQKTTDSINQTVESIGDLQDSIKNVVPTFSSGSSIKTNSGDTDTGETNN